MPQTQGKIKEFFEHEAEKVEEKIKRTPIEKFFIIFLIIITFSAIILGYLQFKKNIESPLFSSYLTQKRAEEYQNYLNATSAGNLNLGTVQSQVGGSSTNSNQSSNENSDINASSSSSVSNDLLDAEQKLLSGEATLKDFGIDNPELQQQLDTLKSTNANLNQTLTPDEQTALGGLKNMTPQEIRAELLKEGVDQNTLNNISDDNLQKIFLDVLNQYQ